MFTGFDWHSSTRHGPDRLEMFTLDIQSHNHSHDNLRVQPFKTIKLSQLMSGYNVEVQCDGATMHADEYQIGVLAKLHPWDESRLFISDFCGNLGYSRS